MGLEELQAQLVHCPALRRPTPRRARKSRPELQAHPDARRTFHEPRGPPGTDEERARGLLHSFGCHVTAGTRHPRLIAHTQTRVVNLNQGVKVSEGVEAVGNRHRGRIGKIEKRGLCQRIHTHSHIG